VQHIEILIRFGEIRFKAKNREGRGIVNFVAHEHVVRDSIWQAADFELEIELRSLIRQI
jgi:hypothetical protein